MSGSESKQKDYEAEDPDVRLMLRVQNGDAGAFEELVCRYQNRLLGILEHLVGSRDLAEDLAQEVFLRVYRARARYLPNAKFSTWLFTIAKRTAMNHYRAAPSTVELTPEKEVDERDPSRVLEEKDQAQSLWHKARRLLKPSQFEALWLRYGEGFSIGETAKVMRTNELRVRVLLHRARTKMAKQLDPQASRPTGKTENPSRKP